MKRVSVIGVLCLLLMGILVVSSFALGVAEKPATAQTPTAQKGVLEPTKASLAKLGEYLPKLGGLLVILVIGALIAVGISALVAQLLKVLQLEKVAKKIKIPEILKKGGIGLTLSELITEIIFFLIAIATLITALEFYGVGTAVLTNPILAYVPQVISAVFILILGILVAILISGIIKLVGGNVKIAQSDTLGNVAKYAIIILSTVIALRELGLGIILTDKSKDIIFAGLVLALALGFGLALKEKANKFLDNVFKK